MKFTTKRGKRHHAPRHGQWVILDGKQIGIAVGPDYLYPEGWKEAGQDVGGKSVYKTYGDVVLQLPYPPLVRDFPTDDTRVQVDLVDPVGGLKTIAHLMVDYKRLEPVTKLEDIPAGRRSLQDPEWKGPRA